MNHAIAEALTTGRIILSGNNSPPAEVLTRNNIFYEIETLGLDPPIYSLF